MCAGNKRQVEGNCEKKFKLNTCMYKHINYHIKVTFYQILMRDLIMIILMTMEIISLFKTEGSALQLINDFLIFQNS